jgi:hypothetical protein
MRMMDKTAAPGLREQVPEKQRYMRRLARLQNERSSWLSHWQEINDNIMPRRMRYLQTDRNKGTKRNDKIINSKPIKASQTLGAGKMAGMTSPARPWYRYIVSDPVAKHDPDALMWARDTEQVVGETFARSNIYSKIHELWFLQGGFGTSLLYIEEDDETDIRAYVIPIGRYCLADSTGSGRIDTVFDEFAMTVEQVVREFGIDSVSMNVRQNWEDGKYDEWVEILHVVEPNINRDTGKIDNWNMPFKSIWFEKTAPDEHTSPLRRSGYEEFPYMVARWDVIGEDVYGSGCPGMNALGDCKGLQVLEKRKAEAAAMINKPPMKAPVSARAARLSLLPGDVSYVDETAQTAKFSAAVETRPDAVTVMKDAIVEHERRIVEIFFANLFEMMLLDDRQQPATAREIDERHNEKMLMLGPVVERDEDDVLDPLHNRAIRVLYRRGKLLPVPRSLLQSRVKIEYISIMAQAQKLLGIASTERAVSFTGSTSAIQKEVLDIPNWDVLTRRYLEKLGLAPDEINTPEVVAQLRAARAQEAQMAQMAQQAQVAGQAAQAAKVASETDMTGDTALSRLLNTVGGGGGPIGRA